MSLSLPNLDDRTYNDLVAEALNLIPTYAPEWTNHNPADPGITLIEMFAHITEMLLYRQNRITQQNIQMFLRLLNGPKWQPGADLQADIRQSVLQLRQRQRAITCDDFEELALAAHPDVARTHCVPRRDLTLLDSSERYADRPEHISVIVVPKAVNNTIPQPELSLLTTVSNYLEPRRLLTTPVHIVAPRYLSIRVRLRLQVRRDAQPLQVETQAISALQQFFHPLEGGEERQGWKFGRSVYVSEIYSLLDRVPGVDYVTKIENQDEIVVDDTSGQRVERNSTEELVAIALEPDELVAIQVNSGDLQIESPIRPFNQVTRS
ncbi:MAG: baseplate J/gp47 family protein [Scytonema sp. PMC 1069.18]|nr:baseplate J/gp47 family protein [Scytonema sp. PMC 1069.18]MEC4883964.1 baseplate J/gp47 family protein [Scytonema sp. PMC 1070.18]